MADIKCGMFADIIFIIPLLPHPKARNRPEPIDGKENKLKSVATIQVRVLSLEIEN